MKGRRNRHLHALLPALLLCSPAVASSVHTVSTSLRRSCAVNSGTHEAAALDRIEHKEHTQGDPFNAFGDGGGGQTTADADAEAILDFLERNGLLHSQGESVSRISGDIDTSPSGRKDFAHAAAYSHCHDAYGTYYTNTIATSEAKCVNTYGGTWHTKTTAPVFEDVAVVNKTATSFDLNVDLNQSSTVHAVLLLSTADAPTSTQVKNGQDGGGSAALQHKTISVDTSPYTGTISFTGLTESESYLVYLVGENAGSGLTPEPEVVNPAFEFGTVFSTTGYYVYPHLDVSDNGNIYVAFWNNDSRSYQFGKWDETTSSWNNNYTSFSSTHTGTYQLSWGGYNRADFIVTSPDAATDNLHMVFGAGTTNMANTSDPYYGLYNGSSWSFAKAYDDVNQPDNYDVFFDGDGKVHITYELYDLINDGDCTNDYYRLRYVNNAAGAFPETAATIHTNSNVADCSQSHELGETWVLKESGGTTHIFYASEDNPLTEAYYMADSSDNFATKTRILDSVGDVKDYEIGDVVIDDGGRIHLVYSDRTNGYAYYRTNASGSWVTTELTTSGLSNLSARDLQIVGTTIYIAMGSSSGNYIKAYDGTTWYDGNLFQLDGYFRQFAIDAVNDRLMVVAEDSSNPYLVNYHTGRISDYVVTSTVDTTAPTVSSIIRQAPASAVTNADSVVFRVTFSEDVVNIGTGDFTLSGSAAADGGITGVSAVSASIYDITVSGIGASNGTVNLDIDPGHDIEDSSANALTDTTPVGADQTYSLDNLAPFISDQNLSVSGASGTGGAFRTGDTVTATWDDSAATGDGNGDTANVTMDFSQFGGGAAVAAANSSDSWTASYTITAGTLDATNRSVSITATDTAGNEATLTDGDGFTVDNASPQVSDAHLEVGGGSGTGGAFVAGDTATASWDNTVLGDNNGDIAGVTIDFSQFGCGAAVAAVNSASTWSATCAITGGTIDAANVNISASVTDDAGNTTITADSSNAEVDNQVPLLSDSHLDIGGATGLFGTFRIGDTVAATWDNTGGGDNNGDIAGVTVDFSGFGGGAAVAASNSSDTWTATHTLASGAIDATNVNISATVSDDAGNTVATADTTNALVDIEAPLVRDVSLTIGGASGNGGVYTIGDTVTASWDNSAGGDNNGDIATVTMDFSAFGGGTSVAADYDAGSGVWSAGYTLAEGAGGGIEATNRNIEATAGDNAGNTTTTADTTNAEVDNVRPAAPTTPDLTAATDLGDSASDDITSDTTPDFSGTAEPGVAIEVTSSVDGVVATTSADGSGTWIATAASLSSADHQIKAVAADAAGNRSDDSGALAVTIDGIPPAAPSTPDMSASSDTGISDSDNTTADNTPAFTGSGPAGRTVTLYSSTDGMLGSVDADGTGNWELISVPLSDGNHSISALTSDVAGNTATSAGNLAVLIDTRAPAAPSVPDMPAASDNGTSDSDNSTSDTTPTFQGSAESNVTVILTSSVDGQIGSAQADGAGIWTVAVNTLSYGNHDIGAHTKDDAGNASSHSGWLAVRINHDPVFTSTPSVAGTAEVGETLTLENTGTHDEDLEEVTLDYQWQRNGSDIEGATQAVYLIGESDSGTSLVCHLTALDQSGGAAFHTTESVSVKGDFPWVVLLPGLVSPNKAIDARDNREPMN